MVFCILLLNLAAVNNFGSFVGNLTTNAYGVRGQVYVVSLNKIRVRRFFYDGNGPDAFFYIGRKSDTNSLPNKDGILLPDHTGRTMRLDGYSNADIVLTLPAGVEVIDIKWLSVWCRQAEVDFGSLMFPSALTVPMSSLLGAFQGMSHGVSSGTVTVINSKQIQLENFKYDGSGEAYFWVGVGSPDNNAVKIMDENNRATRLGAYNGQTITLMVQGMLTAFDIDYLAVGCQGLGASCNYGHVMVTKNVQFIPYTANIEGYYGKLVGDLNHYAHNLYGTLYILDQNRLRIRNFYYDGQGPDAFFWMGSSASTDSTGSIIPDEHGRLVKLGAYTNADIVLTLPPGKLVQSMWFSVWCRQFAANFGDIYFPKVYSVPEKHVLGQFTQYAHGVKSGTVTILDTRRVMIENLHYDGLGPDAYFWIGTGASPTRDGWKIPDETGSLTKLNAYRDQTITLTLPAQYSFFTIDWLSMWCVLAVQNFGHVTIPDNLNIPPYIEQSTSSMSNCEQLHDYLSVAWDIHDNQITMEMTGAFEDDDMGYMAFGLSSSNSRSAMVGADVFVASYQSMAPSAVDYKLTAYSQCSSNGGSCPDTYLSGRNDLTLIEGYQKDGITTVKFSRPLTTNDSNDIAIATDHDMYIVWAMGRLSNDGFVTKHNLRLTTSKMLNFGRTPMNNCKPVVSRKPVTPSQPWPIPVIRDTLLFTASIGPAGPENKGYAAITGQQSWGIAWYINNQLIPEIEVQRGIEYTFTIQGGSDPSNPAKYHPFYITDSAQGGYVRKSGSEKQSEQVFAGVDGNGDPTAAGQYCEFITSTQSSTKVSSFSEYFSTLTQECVAGQPAVLKWTPNESTPDTVYYQCYTHRYLGWKIHVRDSYTSSGSLPNASIYAMLAIMLLYKIIP